MLRLALPDTTFEDYPSSSKFGLVYEIQRTSIHLSFLPSFAFLLGPDPLPNAYANLDNICPSRMPVSPSLRTKSLSTAPKPHWATTRPTP